MKDPEKASKRNLSWDCFIEMPLYFSDQRVESEVINDQTVNYATKTTHLGSINIQAHVVAVVSGHQVSPDVGSVPLVAVDGGGF